MMGPFSFFFLRFVVVCFLIPILHLSSDWENFFLAEVMVLCIKKTVYHVHGYERKDE